MSFIKNDPELITILMGAGAAHLMKFGQGNPAAPATQIARDPNETQLEQSRQAILPYRVALPMLVNLQRQIDPANSLPKAIPLGAEDPNIDLNATVTNLRSLGDFITWAAQKN